MTIPICVNRKLLRMKSTAKQENNRNFEKNSFFSLIFSLILHQFILSDHRPVAATIKTAAIPQNLLCDNKTQHEKI